MFKFLKSIFFPDIDSLSYKKAFTKALKAEKNKNYELAIRLYGITISKGSAEYPSFALNNLALIYKNGMGVQQNTSYSRELLDRALNEGLYNYRYNPAVILNQKLFCEDVDYHCTGDSSASLNKLIEEAESGDIEFQYILYKLYENHAYFEKDDVSSNYWLKLAASNGHQLATAALEHQKNENEEAGKETNLVKLAEKGEPEGLYYKALMFTHYKRTQSYTGECIDLIEEAAIKGNFKAQYFLGLIYETGRYLDKQRRGEKTQRSFGPVPLKICDDYIPNINSFVFFNEVSSPNQSLAIEWFKKSAKLGYSPALDKLESLGVTPSVTANDDTSIKEQNSFFQDYDIKFLFHMTHVKNLKKILTHGLQPHGNEFTVEKIDNPDVNSIRCKFEPIFQKSLHDYVPFYLNPKNPMLYVNRDRQNDIVLLAFDKTLILNNGVIFTDGNAASNKTLFFSKAEELVNLNWKCLSASFWNDFVDGKRERMAEVLVPNIVDKGSLKKIICFNAESKKLIDSLNEGVATEINPNFYF